MIKAHAWAIFLAVAVGVLYSGPDIYHALTPGYQGIVMADSSDAAFYLTNINKSYEAPGLLGDPFLYEYQNVRNPFQYFLPDFVIGKAGALLHLPIDTLVIVMELFFPALLALLLYAFAYALSGNRLTAFFVSAALLLGNEIVHPDGIGNLFSTFAFHGSHREFLTYSRPINPQVSSVFFFSALWLLLRLLQSPHSKWRVALAGAAVGLLVYIYVYFWAFAFVLLWVMFLYALLVRNWPLVFAACMAGAAGIFCMVPFLLANLPIFLHGGGSALSDAIRTHQPILEKVILLPLFLYAFVYFSAWKGHGSIRQWALGFGKKYLFVILLLITGVMVLNQQILTGKVVFQQHFHFFTNIPVFLFAMSFLFMELMIFFLPRWRGLSVMALVFIFAWFALGVQVSSYKAHATESARYQALAPIFSYLREQAPVQSVVLEDSYLSPRLTIYTQAFSYNASGYDATYQVPQERIVHDYFVALALRGITAEAARAYMYRADNRDEIGYTIFVGTYWRDLCGSGGCFPDSVLEDLIPQYKVFSTHPLVESIHTHKIDYVLWDKATDPDWQISNIAAGSPLIESGDFALYKVR